MKNWIKRIGINVIDEIIERKIVLGVFLLCVIFVESVFFEINYEDVKITDGIIYEKEILNGETRRTSLYSVEYFPTRYRLYVTNEIDYIGKKVQKKTHFDVSEGTYYMYSIGDWFDSQNPRKKTN